MLGVVVQVRAVRLVLVAATLAVLAAIVVPEARALRFADSPCAEGEGGVTRICPGGVVGKAYTLELAGEGGCGPALPYRYRLVNGVLPPGISLSADGQLSGAPTTAGTWDFWLELSDEDPPSAPWCLPKKSEREFRIRVGAPPATVGSPFSVALGAPGAGSRSWSLVSGALPQGLRLDPVGVIAGIPQGVGVYPVAFSAVDAAGHTARLELTLTVYARLVVATLRLPSARSGRSFSARLRTRGGVGGVTFSVVSGRLPIGVRLSPRSGVIRGTPRKAGIYRLRVRAQDSLGRAAVASIVLTVRQA